MTSSVNQINSSEPYAQFLSSDDSSSNPARLFPCDQSSTVPSLVHLLQDPFHSQSLNNNLSSSSLTTDYQNDSTRPSAANANYPSNSSLGRALTTTTINSTSSINASYSKQKKEKKARNALALHKESKVATEKKRAEKTNKAKTCYALFCEAVIQNLNLKNKKPESEIEIKDNEFQGKLNEIFNSLPKKVTKKIDIQIYKNIEESLKSLILEKSGKNTNRPEMIREVSKKGTPNHLNSWKRIANKTDSFFKKNPKSHNSFDKCVQATRDFYLDVNEAREKFLQKIKNTGDEDITTYLQDLEVSAIARKPKAPPK